MRLLVGWGAHPLNVPVGSDPVRMVVRAGSISRWTSTGYLMKKNNEYDTTEV